MEIHELDRLGDEIAELSAHLEAATAHLLDLIREFDAGGGWNTGFRSCAAWLAWRVGLDPGAARERVRVAHALGTLPLLARALARGELSYAKVRALTRVATPETEARLLAVGRAGTAAHVERIVRGWRRVDRKAEARETARRHASRALHVYQDEDGMGVLRGRLAREVGALLVQALTAAREALYQRAHTINYKQKRPRRNVSSGRWGADGVPGFVERRRYNDAMAATTTTPDPRPASPSRLSSRYLLRTHRLRTRTASSEGCQCLHTSKPRVRACSARVGLPLNLVKEGAIVRAHGRLGAGPDVTHVFLAAVAAALRGLGQPGEAAAAARARRARSLSQLGLDGGGAARRLARHRAGSPRPRRQPVVHGRQLHDGRLHLRSRPAGPPAAAGAGDDHRALARRQRRAPVRRHLSGPRGPARRHRGARAVGRTAGRAASHPES